MPSLKLQIEIRPDGTPIFRQIMSKTSLEADQHTRSIGVLQKSDHASELLESDTGEVINELFPNAFGYATAEVSETSPVLDYLPLASEELPAVDAVKERPLLGFSV